MACIQASENSFTEPIYKEERYVRNRDNTGLVKPPVKCIDSEAPLLGAVWLGRNQAHQAPRTCLSPKHTLNLNGNPGSVGRSLEEVVIPMPKLICTRTQRVVYNAGFECFFHLLSRDFVGTG